MPSPSVTRRRTALPPPPTIIQSTVSAWTASNTSSFNAILSSSPTKGNLLLAFYGGYTQGAFASTNILQPPTGFTQLQYETLANPSNANLHAIGLATRTVQSGDSTTWAFTLSNTANGSSSAGVGAFIFEVKNAGSVTSAVNRSDGTPIGQATITSTPASLIIAACAMFTATNGQNGWSYASGWAALLTDGSSGLNSGMASASISGNGSSLTSTISNSPINGSNPNWVATIINVARL